MRKTKENVKKAKQHPMLLDAANILNQDAYNAFYTSYMDLRDDLEQKPHLFKNKID